MARLDYERMLARLHVDRVLDSLGHSPSGIHVVVVPESSTATVWQDAAVLAVRDIREARGLTPVSGDKVDMNFSVEYQRAPFPTLRDSHGASNLNPCSKREVCDGFSNFVA